MWSYGKGREVSCGARARGERYRVGLGQGGRGARRKEGLGGKRG